jgi:hypothetical protein
MPETSWLERATTLRTYLDPFVDYASGVDFQLKSPWSARVARFMTGDPVEKIKAARATARRTS